MSTEDNSTDAREGPYRVGDHSPVNVWFDPQRGEKTGVQVCMATEPHWAEKIVAALNARAVEPAELDALREEHARWEYGLGQITGSLLSRVDPADPSLDLRRAIARKITALVTWPGDCTECARGMVDVSTLGEPPHTAHAPGMRAGCPTHGRHPHDGRRCTDCPTCTLDTTEQAARVQSNVNAVVLGCSAHGMHPHSGHECDACQECTQGPVTPATPTKPRVWPTNQSEPPHSVAVLFDRQQRKYLCRLPHDWIRWNWFKDPEDRFADHRVGGVIWSKVCEFDSVRNLVEVVEDGAPATTEQEPDTSEPK